MKIAQIATIMNPLHGGAPATTLNMFEKLAEKHDPTLIVVGESHDFRMQFVSQYSAAKAILFICRKRASMHGYWLSREERKEIEDILTKSDLIIMHQVFNITNVQIYFISKKYGIPYAIMPHGSLTSYHLNQKKIRKRLGLFIIFRALIEDSFAMFVASKREAEEISSRFSAEPKVLGIGFNNDIVESSRSNPNEYNLLFMGRISKKKNLNLSIRVFDELLKRGIRSRFIIAGSPDNKRLYSKSLKLIEELGLNSKIDIIGWVSDKEKRRVLQSSDIFVLLSEDENFGVAVAEAQSYGIPVVISDKVALSEGVEVYTSGVVTNSKDPKIIADQIESKLLINYENMSRNALKFAKELQWKKVIQNWDNFLESPHLI